MIQSGQTAAYDPRGIAFSVTPMWQRGQVAFVFPGQGAPSPGMLKDLTIAFPEVRSTLNHSTRP